MGCKNFCAFECVNGSCPIALKNGGDELMRDLASIAYDEINDCTACYYNTFDCKDCIFTEEDWLCEDKRKVRKVRR